ncbi:MAG: hypothetical protein WAP35_08875, partial [Solirubrobacterales bacterium]
MGSIDGLGHDLAEAFDRAERGLAGFGDPPRRIRPRRAVLAVAALLVLISIPTYVLTRDATQLRAL